MKRLSFLLLLAACASTDQEGLLPGNVMLHVRGSVVGGSTATAVFRNTTSSDLSVGDLGCVIDLEKSVHGGWQPVPSDRACRAFARVVPAGDSLVFSFPAPGATGVYRIQSQGTVQIPDGPGWSLMPLMVTPLQSEPFEVHR